MAARDAAVAAAEIRAPRRAHPPLSAVGTRGDGPRRSAPLSAARAPGAAEAVAGLLASSSIAASLISLAWRPLRLVLISLFLALLAVAIGGRHTRLATFAAGIGAVCFFGGMAIAILTENPLW